MSLEKEFHEHLERINSARANTDDSDPSLLALSDVCYPVNLMIPADIMEKISVVADLRGIPLDVAIIETIYDSKLMLLPVDTTVYCLDKEEDKIIDVSNDFVVSIVLVDPDLLEKQDESKPNS